MVVVVVVVKVVVVVVVMVVVVWAGGKMYTYHTTLSPAERFCIKMCRGVSHFNASLIVRRKATRDNVRK